MSDKVELIAAAQVTVISGAPGSINFASNHGFETASRGSPGVYELTLEHKHDARKLVINVTLDNTTSGQIAATPLGSGDVKSIGVNCFDSSNAAADSSFFITIQRVRD